MPCWRDEHGIMKPECWHHAGHPKIIASVREAKWRALPQASRDARHIATSNPASVIALCDAVLAQAWRTMDSAPRDGTDVLIRCPMNTVHEARWIDWSHARFDSRHRETGWWWAGYDGAVGPVYPTHWQPLPTPPAQGGEHG